MEPRSPALIVVVAALAVLLAAVATPSGARAQTPPAPPPVPEALAREVTRLRALVDALPRVCARAECPECRMPPPPSPQCRESEEALRRAGEPAAYAVGAWMLAQRLEQPEVRAVGPRPAAQVIAWNASMAAGLLGQLRVRASVVYLLNALARGAANDTAAFATSERSLYELTSYHPMPVLMWTMNEYTAQLRAALARAWLEWWAAQPAGADLAAMRADSVRRARAALDPNDAPTCNWALRVLAASAPDRPAVARAFAQLRARTDLTPSQRADLDGFAAANHLQRAPAQRSAPPPSARR